MLFSTSSKVAANVQESTVTSAVVVSAAAHNAEYAMEQVTTETSTLRSVRSQLASGDLEKVNADISRRIEEL